MIIAVFVLVGGLHWYGWDAAKDVEPPKKLEQKHYVQSMGTFRIGVN